MIDIERGSRSWSRSRLQTPTPFLDVVDHSCGNSPETPKTPYSPERAALALIRCGAVELRVAGRRALADPSQVVMINPGDTHQVRHHGCVGGACVTTLHLHEVFLADLVDPQRAGLEKPRLQPFSTPLLAPSARLAAELQEILRLTRRTPRTAPPPLEEVKHQVRRAFALALAECERPQEGVPSACCDLSELPRRAREMLVCHATEGIAVRHIARHLGCTRPHLCRVFKAEVGLTTSQYLHRVRVAQALHRIGDGEDDLSRLAADLGFSSHSHFTCVFKRLLGVPPSKVASATGWA